MSDPRYFEPAETQYNDFIGTCAFDQPQTERIEDVLRLPKDRYWVLGFSLFSVTTERSELDFGATAYVVEFVDPKLR
jgi:hypothetical protein